MKELKKQGCTIIEHNIARIQDIQAFDDLLIVFLNQLFLTLNAGFNKYEIETDKLNSGLYMLKVSDKYSDYIGRFIIEK